MSAREQVDGSLANAVRSTQMEFSFNADANDGDEINKEVPFDGRVVEMLYGASAATNNRVGVQVNYQGEQKFPGNREDDFIALADVVHPFLLVFDVKQGEDITVRYENQDGSPHFVNVVFTVAQFEGGTRGQR